MNGVTKSVILALALTALPLAATAQAEKSKDWPSFKKVDADNNGAISQDEARTVSGLSDTMTSYDKNGDGQLSRSEYEAAKKATKSGGASTPGSSSGPAGGAGPGAGSSGAAGGAAGSGSGSRY